MAYYRGNLISIQEIYLNSRIELMDIRDEKEKKIGSLSVNKQITDPKILFFLENLFARKNQKELKKINSLEGINIIYSIVKDKDNNLYAKELFTECLFPILTPAHLDFSYKVESVVLKKKINILVEPTISPYSLYIPKVVLVSGEDVKEEELDLYLHQFDKGFSKNKNKEKFIRKIHELYSKNIPKINLKEESLKKMQMKNIERLIVDLMDINKKLALEFRKEYEILIQGNFNEYDLASLEIDIEESLLFKDPSELDFLNYLKSWKKKYLMNLLIGEKTVGLTIKNIDKFKIILLDDNKCSFYAKNKIIHLLSLLYLFEVYEERNNITLETLNNSCFKEFLCYIVNSLKSLKEIGIINCDSDLGNVSTVENVLQIIKEIEFVRLSEDKVKKIIMNY